MDRELIRATVQDLRNQLHRLTRATSNDDSWQSIQAADHLLEKLSEANVSDQILVNSTLSLAIPYVSEVARFRGMMEIMSSRHPILNTKYEPVGNPLDLSELGRDFWHMYNLLRERNGTDEQSRIPGSPSESSPSGHVQPGE